MTIFNQRANNPFYTAAVFILTASVFVFLVGFAQSSAIAFWIARLFLVLPYVFAILFAVFLLWEACFYSKKDSDDDEGDDDSDDSKADGADEKSTNIPDIFFLLRSIFDCVIPLVIIVFSSTAFVVLSLPMSHPRDLFQIAIGSFGYTFIFWSYRTFFKKDVEPQDESDATWRADK